MMMRIRWLCCATVLAVSQVVSAFPPPSIFQIHRRLKVSQFGAATEKIQEERSPLKKDLLRDLESVPSNAPTPARMTQQILDKVLQLERSCPTKEEDVFGQLAGNWELIWTTQDRQSNEWKNNPIGSFINPLENQSYSNNPGGEGRANPFLPRTIQDQVEKMGFRGGSAKSTQDINLKEGRVKNVVFFELPAFEGQKRQRATLVVDIGLKPNMEDKRRVDVKFNACRVLVPSAKVDFNIPLGLIGPTGWLRTGYVDETIRITRGHKGSVFILKRIGKQA